MRNMPLPVGKPTYFNIRNGDLKNYLNENELFGFVYVTVHAPEGMNKPILPFKTKVKGSTSTIYPTGS